MGWFLLELDERRFGMMSLGVFAAVVACSSIVPNPVRFVCLGVTLFVLAWLV